MRALPMLEGRRGALEKCVFCPKLCRSACPVSNAEPRETITPWGKMSLAWMTAHGDVPLDASHAKPAWACTGCMACRESCDHRNPVADVLYDARAALVRAGGGVAPEGAKRAIARFDDHDAKTRAAVRGLAGVGVGVDVGVRVDVGVGVGVDSRAPDALLIGCGYVRRAPGEARDAIAAASALLGGPVSLVERCCGLPLRMAGDRDAFAARARALAAELAAKRRVVVVDAGCAMALRKHYPDAGAALPSQLAVELLVDLAARALGRLSRVHSASAEPVRWHDPCQLARGLGVTGAPRDVLSRALGRAPDELDDRREHAICSGAGGLLPATHPDIARGIADDRLAAHARAGGGRIVTACASSLVALRKRAPSGVAVDDIVTWIRRALV
jgi:Fe-S oxidoreductase